MEYEIFDVKKQISDVANNIGKESFGLRSGLESLDNQIRGFDKGDYVIVAGRPSMGKSAFATTAALEIGKKSKVIVFSLEMNCRLFAERMIVNLAEVNYHKLKLDAAEDEEWGLVEEAAQELAKRHIFIDDTSRLTPLLLQQKLSYVRIPYGLDCCIIDYLQLMDMGWRKESRQMEITDISRELKATAKDLDIPIIVLSQLSRATEQRVDRRPRLSDLRESGSLEQDAHKVLLLYRPAYYGDSEDNKEVEINIAKNRSGPTGAVKVHWLNSCMKFVDVKGEF